VGFNYGKKPEFFTKAKLCTIIKECYSF